MAFKFALGENVVIALNGKVGTVYGRSEHLDQSMPNHYSLYYINGSGDAVYDWFMEHDLTSI